MWRQYTYCDTCNISSWHCHGMETLSALLSLCEGDGWIPVIQGPIMRSSYVSLISLNKMLKTQLSYQCTLLYFTGKQNERYVEFWLRVEIVIWAGLQKTFISNVDNAYRVPKIKSSIEREITEGKISIDSKPIDDHFIACMAAPPIRVSEIYHTQSFVQHCFLFLPG